MAMLDPWNRMNNDQVVQLARELWHESIATSHGTLGPSFAVGYIGEGSLWGSLPSFASFFSFATLSIYVSLLLYLAVAATVKRLEALKQPSLPMALLEIGILWGSI